uniref:SF3 helicase domain-containing protein n=1 Tax=viral metagenome TaxID=1070528 RepID=A0A6C0EK03_9ZZZZ
MDPKIRSILNNNYVDGIFHTHVSLIRPRGKFQFNRQTLEEFWKEYCRVISESEDPVVGIAEKPQYYLPILVDVDLRVRDEGDDGFENGLYTEEQLKAVIEVYQSVLRQIVEDCNDRDLTCVVLEKNMYMQTKNDITYLKHGFHLHFPFCFLSKADQEVQLIPRVKDALKELGTFANLGFEDSGEVIDKSCCKVPWLLYGSRKGEDHQPYKVTKVYNSEMAVVSLERAFKHYQLFDHREQLICIKGKVRELLPRILSIVPYGRTVKEVKRGLISPLKEKIKRKERNTSVNHRKLTSEEALEIARKLLPMLSDFRAEDRNEWMTIGWILYNVSDGHSDALDLWCEFSSRCEDKYDENECIHHWERMTKKDLTLGTLRYYASIDNPGEYKRFKNEEAKKHIKNSLEGSHNDVAKALYAEYGDEFVCGSIANKVWFQFVGHRWEQIEEGIYLREKISGRIINKYFDAIQELYQELRDEKGDKAKDAMTQAKIKQVNKMIANLKSAPYKNNVLKECMEVFYDPRFREKLDADPYIIGFKNGVYDLRLNIFRPGRPEDFLSKSMPIEYVAYTEDDEAIGDVHTFLEQIFPDKSLRKYFLDISSDVFVGGNHEKIVVFWTGDGDNGKSIMQKFFELMLGPLAIKLNTNVITGKKPSAGAAFADLARAGGGVRWATLEEPDSDEVINIGVFKHLSGGDSFYARDLFERGKDGREIVPMFKLSFICNKLPRMKYADKAVWNRARVLPFESTFCRPSDPAPESYEEQLKQKRFPMDKNFSKKIPGMVSAFAWILLQHRLKIKVRIEPSKVIAATEMYRKQNDVYRQFIEESICEDPDKYISLIELYNMFKEWFRNSLPGHTVPVKNEVEEYFIKLWGTPEAGKKWKGFRHRVIQDDIKNGDAVVLTKEDLVDYSDEAGLPPI